MLEASATYPNICHHPRTPVNKGISKEWWQSGSNFWKRNISNKYQNYLPSPSGLGDFFIPLHPIMNTRTKRSISAWLLLSVFLPMLLLSSLHVHEYVDVRSGCPDCINHIAHQGHISLDTIHLHDCLLCHFASISFLVAATVVLAPITQSCFNIIVEPSAKLRFATYRHHSPRAPPVLF